MHNCLLITVVLLESYLFTSADGAKWFTPLLLGLRLLVYCAFILANVNVINGDWRHALLSIGHQIRRLLSGRARQFNYFVPKPKLKMLKKMENAKRHARKKSLKSSWE